MTDNLDQNCHDRDQAPVSFLDLTRRATMRLGAGVIGMSVAGLGSTRRAAGSPVHLLEPPATAADIPADEPVDRDRMTERVLDIAEGEDLSAHARASESGEMLVVPEGTYTWTRSVTHSRTDWGIRGEWGGDVRIIVEDGWGLATDDHWLIDVDHGDNVIVENLRIDTPNPAGRATPGIRLYVPQAALLHHVVWLHKGPDSQSKTKSRVLPYAYEEDGHVMLDGIVINNRGNVDYDNTGDRLAWSACDGKLTFRNIKAGGFSDNVIYTRMPGEMVVENCVLANTTPTCIRLGGDNEVIRNCTFWVDTDRDVELYNLEGNSVNMAPVMADNRNNASDGGYIENCTFIVNNTPNASGVFRYLTNRWIEVSDCQVIMDDPDVPATNLSNDEAITWTNVSFATTNRSGATVAPNPAATYTTENVHVDADLDPGSIDPDSRDPSFDDRIHHPFPEDGDITLPSQYGDVTARSAVTYFGHASVGELPGEWDARWAGAASDFTVAADDDALGGRLLAAAGGDDARRAIAWNEIPDDAADVEVLAKLWAPSDAASGDGCGVYVRGGGSAGDEAGYAAELRVEDGFVLSALPAEELGRSGSPTPDTWYWVRLRASYTGIKMRHWEQSSTEPERWNLAVDDDSHSAGWVGVGSLGGSGGAWDVVSVGTGGERAPMPNVSPPFFELSEIDGVRNAVAGEAYEVGVLITNRGDVGDAREIQYVVDDEAVETVEIDLDAGEEKRVTFSHSVDESSVHEHGVDTGDMSEMLALVVDDGGQGSDSAGDSDDDSQPAPSDEATAGRGDEGSSAADSDGGDSDNAIPGFGVGATIASLGAGLYAVKRWSGEAEDPD